MKQQFYRLSLLQVKGSIKNKKLDDEYKKVLQISHSLFFIAAVHLCVINALIYQQPCFLALLPLSTAIFAVIRGGEKPRPIFWLFSIIGSLLVMGYALSQGGVSSISADLLMIASVIVCGLGYAEGASLTKALGGWQVICWALIVSLPPMLILSFILMPEELATISVSAWVGLGYVSLFSMLIGFIFWYKGLSQGGIAAVGQLQLLQPFFGLGLAAVLLHESVNLLMLLVTIGVIFCVAGSRKYA
ncbi:DMT family transporter [Proteus mirabilis]|nr:DMT family transporter [Proteus mirabilis]MBG3152722.1 DMT family transporter [Proteus mirabilis]